ncbi:MAG: NADH-quinone oxidoreductase subunit C [Acidimicrobiales bacterium]
MSTADQDAAAPEAAESALPDVPTAPGRWVDEVAFPPLARYHELVAAYKASGFEQLSDLTAVDYLTHPGRALPLGVSPERFEVVVNLLSLSKRRRVRVRVQVPGDEPVVDTLWDLYPGVEAMEREVFDLFGVRFAGHPDLTRILMPEDWEGHPLRKDYGVGRVPVQFKEAPGPR